MDIQSYISSGIIEAYVMGLATEEEIQILECVQKNSAAVKQAIMEAQETLAGFAEQEAIAPPTHLKAAIWAKIQEEEEREETAAPENKIPLIAEIPVVEPTPTRENTVFVPNHAPVQRANKVPFKTIAAAASILFIVSAGGLVYLNQEQQKTQKQLTALQQEQQQSQLAYNNLQKKWDMSSNPEMKTIALTGVEKHPGMKAMVYLDHKTNQAYLSVENLPPAPKDQQYQLWAIVDGKPVDAGMYDPRSDGSVQKMYAVANAQAFAITLEKSGGSPSPTMENMYVMGKI
ncbi:hypothetical protein DBR32_01065 [Taibaiella sp. KBW10]|uniref:anti-sigma factor n=1 Tax=Taibaiella sp. KBW10 TaxID=2153357 RepID=UPI000F5A2F72|nr:anti-sigma factor [Taibaiella sp. KBW10]RQO32232.1 hypothetical protein DBR32_01065 [Taibaiella sp. KBW10]